MIYDMRINLGLLTHETGGERHQGVRECVASPLLSSKQLDFAFFRKMLEASKQID